MGRPTMLETYRARKAQEATKPLLAPPPKAVPVTMQGFADLDVGDDLIAFLAATEVRDRLGPELVRLASTAHGAKDLVTMIVDARSPAFWLQLDLPDAYRAYHRLTELRAVVAQASSLKRRH